MCVCVRVCTCVYICVYGQDWCVRVCVCVCVCAHEKETPLRADLKATIYVRVCTGQGDFFLEPVSTSFCKMESKINRGLLRMRSI